MSETVVRRNGKKAIKLSRITADVFRRYRKTFVKLVAYGVSVIGYISPRAEDVAKSTGRVVVCLLIFLVAALIAESAHVKVIALELKHFLVAEVLKHRLEKVKPVGPKIHPVFCSAISARHVKGGYTKNIARKVNGDSSLDSVAC